MLAFLLPAAMVAALGLTNGGFDLEARHIAGLAAWLLVVGLVLLGAAARFSPEKPLFWAAGLILALGALSLASSLWSVSAERSFEEACRILVYLGIFLAALLLTQTPQRRQRFAEGLAVGVAVVLVAALASRLLPELVSTNDPTSAGPRLRYPLGYWNANGSLFGLAFVLFLWAGQSARWSGFRWSATALLPACLTALYFTYSRGAALTLLVGVFALLCLSDNRFRHLIVTTVSALATVPVILAVQSRRQLADGIVGETAVSQGRVVLLLLIAMSLLALLAIAELRHVATRRPGLTRRLVETSRSGRTLRALTVAVSLVAILLIAFFGPRVWSQFSDPGAEYFPTKPEDHFGHLTGAGRSDMWRVAIESWKENPVAGSGAGTYEFAWRQKREIDLPVLDAHSFYLESFAELGTIGGLLGLLMILALLGIGLTSWSRGLREGREMAAALTAVMVAFAAASAFDWFWEMTVLGAIFFAAGGLLTGMRCSQIAAGWEPDAGNSRRRYGTAVAAVAIGWISIAALVGPLAMHWELSRSKSDAAAGDMAGAVDHALSARSLQPWAAAPYIQLGGLADLEGAYSTALSHYQEAARRSSGDWQIWYLSSLAARNSGQEELADRYLERARELNPRAPELAEAAP